MARWVKINDFLVLNGEGKVQPELGDFPDDSYFDTRENCTVEINLEIERGKQLNCNNRDIYGEPLKTRYVELRLNWDSPTPQQIFRQVAYFAGATDVTPASPAQNEVQLLTRTGNPSAGAFKFGFELEGRSGTSKPIGYNEAPAQIVAGITNQAGGLGKIIQPGDITAAGGTAQVVTGTVVGTIGAGGAGNVSVTVTAAGSVALAGGKLISVAVANNDTASQVAAKIRAALTADSDVAAFFTVSGSGANVVLTAKTRAANDATMNLAIVNGTTTDLTDAPTSTNTTPGVAQDQFGSGVYLTFSKRLRNADLPLLTVDNTGLAGGTFAVAQVTPGAQNYHTAQRTDDTSKVLFAVALGNKADASVTKKYGDAVSKSLNFTMDADQTNVKMQAVIGCNFNPDDFTSFVVPACTNAPPVLAADTRIEIDGAFRHRNLVNHAVQLDDQVPMAAMFGFDDPDFTVPPVAGKEPVQGFTTEFYHDAADAASVALRQLALDELTEGNEVAFITHLGNPGNRVSFIADETKIKPQSQLDGNAGPAEQSTIKLTGTPHGITDIPIRFEAYLDQSAAFLGT